MNIETVGIVGAGIMGQGTAQAVAQAGCRVVLLDVSEKILKEAEEKIRRGIRLQGLFSRASESDNQNQALDRIVYSTDYALLSEIEFVVENVTEKWETKKVVYENLERICPPECIYAANTSVIPITRLASLTDRPAKVIGMHFMNPVPMKPMVEVIRGTDTSDETLERAKLFLKRIGKSCIVVKDSPGFVLNRVLMLTINEAICLLDEKISSAQDIDTLFKSCFGHKMGPLETADLIGLDTILYSLEDLHESFKGSKFEPCPLLIRMVKEGHWGRKSGKGFYEYPVNL